ncbi:MAG: hypothetical protein ACJAS9_001377 [Polaribacter sp.]|jgi:hypothetical protein
MSYIIEFKKVKRDKLLVKTKIEDLIADIMTMFLVE